MEYTESVPRKLVVCACLRCGATSVKIHDCGYSAFNAGHVECEGCGYRVNVPGGADSNKQYIQYWNGERDRREGERAALLAKVAELDVLLGVHA